MYKQAIDILMNKEVSLEDIAVMIAKSNPSVFVKAANAILNPEVPNSPEKFFLDKMGENFYGNFALPHHIFTSFIGKYGYEEWLPEVLTHLFNYGADRTVGQKISAIKALRASKSCGLKEAKIFIEAIMEYNLPELSTICARRN